MSPPHLNPLSLALPSVADEEEAKQLLARLNRPTPRIALGIALRNVANACIDVSDGLAADLGHVLDASSVGAELELAALPMSDALRAFDPATCERFQLSGGDDYELCFTAPAMHVEHVHAAATAAGTSITRIGCIQRDSGLRLRSVDGTLHAVEPSGYEHFSHGTASGDSSQ